MECVHVKDYVARQAKHHPDSPAIFAPDKSFITYQQLETKVNQVSEVLLQNGFGNQRIAVVMQNSPEMVVAFYAISDVAAFVPLNPAYSTEEFKNYMELMGVDALLLQAGTYPSAQAAAQDMSIPLIFLYPGSTGIAGDFQINCAGVSKPATPAGILRSSDTAVVMHTSGTTGLPRIVSLTHANLNSFIADACLADITENDRCVHITPLFHIGGIVGPVLSTAATGGSIISIPSFSPKEFLQIIDELSPTWYAAGPAIHQAVIQYIEAEGIKPARYRLRYVRASGAPLPVQTEEKLAAYFNAVVVKVYGLTETSGTGTFTSPIAGKNKHGSVGSPFGCEVAIMDENGCVLAAGEAGAVFIKGSGVTCGYENNETANLQSFHNGWFMTGDQGYFDEDGCLFITGRTKELINRGGVKISPYEVEDALCRHPDILEAAVFAAPHFVFGEAPAAMVVLKPGSATTPRQLKIFLRDKIAQFKIPQQILIVEKIPRGATGKVQRSKLFDCSSELIQSNATEKVFCQTSEFQVPGTDTEKMLKTIWQKIFKIDEISIRDDFMELGGDSLSAAVLFSEINQLLGKKFSINTILTYRTIERLALLLEQDASASQSLVTIETRGERSPLFCIHAVDGDVFSYRKLAMYMNKERPIYGFWFNKFAEGIKHPVEISDLARRYINEMRRVQPTGPYFLAGHSLGGLIAYEMSRQLHLQKQQVALLAMIDTWTKHKKQRKKLLERMSDSLNKASSISLAEIPQYFAEKLLKERERLKQRMLAKRYREKKPDNAICQELQVRTILRSALRNYRLGVYKGKVTYFKSREDPDECSNIALHELSTLADCVQVLQITGNHKTLIEEPHVKELAAKLCHAIQAVEKQNCNF